MHTSVNPHYVTVHLLNMPYHADRPYTYYIPEEFGSIVKRGDLLTVPLGKSRRKEPAIAIGVSDSCDIEDVKPVLAAGNPRLSLNEELLGLCFFMKEQTLCTVGDAVRAIVPTAAMTKLGEYYFCNPAMSEEEAETLLIKFGIKAGYLYYFVKSRGNTPLARIRSEFGEEAGELIECLVRASLFVKDFEIRESTNDRYVTYASLACHAEDALAAAEGRAGANPRQKLRSMGQTRILQELVQAADAVETSVLLERAGASKANLHALEEKQLITLTKVDTYRNSYSDRGKADGKAARYRALSAAQEACYTQLEALYASHEPKAALLHGVTGSGKTRVMKAMIDRVIEDGRTVIILVPEIALTPQTVDIFCGYYGERIAVIHSALSAGERYDAWKRIRNGDVDVVIGTRSAVFAPLENIGMIVIDEEQEHTYKSETTPKYLAHDIARYRCTAHKALMLLASATPSLASYHKAVTGTYTLVELTERYGDAQLPEVVITDMREEMKNGNTSPVGETLLRHLHAVSEAERQAILFLNRRGYNSFLSCKMCGEVVQCPHCTVSLTYHTHRHFTEEERGAGIALARLRGMHGSLVCHYCGYRSPVPEVCPSCGSEHLSYMGFGTQYAEEELQRLLPAARILRMDADTTSGKFAHETILTKFRAGEADILLGTQMVTKGHDFPAVTLAGVFLADSSLYLDDYRAAERTFSMITQVIGRAGRASDKGIAVIQTFNPESDVIQLAAQQDYPAFYQREIALRKALVFPPFCDFAVITLSGTDEAVLGLAATRLAAAVREAAAGEFGDVAMVAYGPFEAPVYKVQNRCRMRMIIKCKLNKRTRAFVASILEQFSTQGKKVAVSVDFNPNTL